MLSIIGRFLEHSRIMYFANDGTPEYYIGSADWMPRNFDRRVEAVTPVEDPLAQEQLGALLEACLADQCQAWDLEATGTWRQRRPVGPATGVHDLLIRHPWGRAPVAV